MEVYNATNWFAVQTKPCSEELANGYISHLGLEVFLPRIPHMDRAWGRGHFVLKPLFPGYLFARFCPEKYLRLVRYARGVRRVVSAGDSLLPVDEAVIRLIRDRVSSHQSSEIGPSGIRPGEEVAVRSGVLAGLRGIFGHKVSDHERVLLLLDAIHYQARILIDSRSLRAVVQVV